ncbi:MAG: hypothetical protein IJX63_02010 [Lachnospiraceae bacterium]|nr:hypothetical protein [Lachnospiraceae bacterium]
MARYMDSAERAEDNRSSAWTLLLVGGIGVIVLILGFFGIIPFPVSGFSKYMFFGVLMVLCLIFIVSGFISLKKSKVYSAAAETEKDNKQLIIDWCIENEVVQKINDSLMNEGEMSVEEEYFKRSERLKHVVFSQFQSMSIEFLSDVVDDIYDSLFEE